MEVSIFLTLLFLAFFTECIDSSIGGGFGTILSPLLLLFNFDPKQIVASIVISEAISGLWGGCWHAKYKNVDFKVLVSTLLGSLTTTTLAVYAVKELLPTSTIRALISAIAILMGLFIFVRSFNLISLIKPTRPSILKAAMLGAVIGFNKGSSGGGYGPFSVTGYMLMGLSPAVAIGTTSLAEGIACTLGATLYLQAIGFPQIALPIVLGSIIASPLGAWANNKLKIKLKPPFHGRFIGLGMAILGVIALLKS